MSEGTFKVLSNPKAETRGQASRVRPRAVDTRTERKGAGDSTSTEDWEKQPGGDPMEAETVNTNTSQAALRGTVRGVNTNDVFRLDKVTLA